MHWRMLCSCGSLHASFTLAIDRTIMMSTDRLIFWGSCILLSLSRSPVFLLFICLLYIEWNLVEKRHQYITNNIVNACSLDWSMWSTEKMHPQSLHISNLMKYDNNSLLLDNCHLLIIYQLRLMHAHFSMRLHSHLWNWLFPALWSTPLQLTDSLTAN